MVTPCCLPPPANCSATSPHSIAIPRCADAYVTMRRRAYWSLMRSVTSHIPTAMPTFSLNLSVDATRKKAPWSLRTDPSSNGATCFQMLPASSLWSIASSITRRSLSLMVIHTAPKKPASEPNSAHANAGKPNHETARFDPLAAHDPLAIPAYWTPEQALAVFELLDDLKE